MNRREFVCAAAAAPFAASVRRLPRRPSALVTCDAEARLAVVDLTAFRVVRSIATLPDPRSVELVGDRAVVCHTAMGAVSIVGRHGVHHVLRGFVEPRYTAAHPDGMHAFVTDSGRSGVVAIDVMRGRVLGAWPCRAGRVTSRSTPGRAALGRARLCVRASRGRRRRRPRHASTLTPGFRAHDVGLAPDGRIWITAGAARARRRRRRRRRQTWRRSTSPSATGPPMSRAATRERCASRICDGRLLRTTPIPAGPTTCSTASAACSPRRSTRGTLAVLDRRGQTAARHRGRGFLPRRLFPALLRFYESLTATQVDLETRREHGPMKRLLLLALLAASSCRSGAGACGRSVPRPGSSTTGTPTGRSPRPTRTPATSTRCGTSRPTRTNTRASARTSLPRCARRSGIRMARPCRSRSVTGCPHNVLVPRAARSSTQSAPHDPAPSPIRRSQDPRRAADADAADTTSSSAAVPVLALGGLALALVSRGRDRRRRQARARSRRR